MITPSQTIVKPMVKIRRERFLPQAGEVVVTPGQEVTPVQVVARTSQEKGFTVIPAAELLGVPAARVPEYLLIEEGTAIQRKKPLLRKRGLFNSKQFTSPINGVLYEVSNGRLILQQTPELFELRAMIRGRVASIRSGWGVIIETVGTVIQAAWGSGREGYGRIRVVTSTRDEPFTEEHIDADVRGTILVAGYLDQRDVLEKAEDNSVRGVIVGSVPAIMAPLLSEFRFPILVTEGFSRQPMTDSIFQLLRESEEREASLFGQKEATQGERPEIIIGTPSHESAAEVSRKLPTLDIGEQVRVLRAPYAGKVGKVVAIHTRPQSNPLGLRLPGADVALDEGQTVFIPYTNLDVIK